MITLFDDQIKLLLSVKETIEGIKETDIYKWENGNSQLTFAVPEQIKIGTVSHDAALSPGDDEIKQSNLMAAPHEAAATPGDI